MRRPTRTRRLSIAAIISCAAFLLVAFAGIRSFWITDGMTFGQHRAVGFISGNAIYVHADYKITQAPIKFQSGYFQKFQHPPGILGFVIWNQVLRASGRNFKVFRVLAPLWPLILLLLITPLRWIMSLPIEAGAFPVVTDGKQQ